MPAAELSLNLATVSRQWKLREAVAAAARHGFAGVAPWRDMVAAVGTPEAARIFMDSGLRVTGYCRGGLFPAADAAGRKAAIDDNKRMIDEAAQIGAECIVMIGGGLPKGSRDLPAARANAKLRWQANERITAKALPTDDRLEQVGIALVGELEIERKGGIEVRKCLENERDAVIPERSECAEFGFGHDAPTIL